VILLCGENNMKSNDIDLHGKFYNDLELTLENHFYNNEPPFKIITGNSSNMKNKVISYLDEHNFKYMSGNEYNQGYIQIL
tara:strand:+ start:20926 stop:21165 length:240 start_codon:yes stop_codon:yes gene_type:complete